MLDGEGFGVSFSVNGSDRVHEIDHGHLREWEKTSVTGHVGNVLGRNQFLLEVARVILDATVVSPHAWDIFKRFVVIFVTALASHALENLRSKKK